jgi:hypothetical protein
MFTPILPVAFDFTSDGTSTAIIVDLSAPTFGLDLRGVQPAGVQSLTVTDTGAGGGLVAGVTASLVGWLLTLTFIAPLPINDTNSVLIKYAVQALLQFASITAP